MAKLPKPKFYLRLPNGDSETLISLMVSYCGKRLVYSTGYSIHPQDWDAKTLISLMMYMVLAALLMRM